VWSFESLKLRLRGAWGGLPLINIWFLLSPTFGRKCTRNTQLHMFLFAILRLITCMVPNGDRGLFHLLLIVLKLGRKCLTSDKYSSTCGVHLAVPRLFTCMVPNSYCSLLRLMLKIFIVIRWMIQSWLWLVAFWLWVYDLGARIKLLFLWVWCLC